MAKKSGSKSAPKVDSNKDAKAQLRSVSPPKRHVNDQDNRRRKESPDRDRLRMGGEGSSKSSNSKWDSPGERRATAGGGGGDQERR